VGRSEREAGGGAGRRTRREGEAGLVVDLEDPRDGPYSSSSELSSTSSSSGFLGGSGAGPKTLRGRLEGLAAALEGPTDGP
jgi:hypothetical protein